MLLLLAGREQHQAQLVVKWGAKRRGSSRISGRILLGKILSFKSHMMHLMKGRLVHLAGDKAGMGSLRVGVF